MGAFLSCLFGVLFVLLVFPYFGEVFFYDLAKDLVYVILVTTGLVDFEDQLLIQPSKIVSTFAMSSMNVDFY